MMGLAMRRLGVAMMVALLLAGCAGPDTAGPTPASSPITIAGTPPSGAQPASPSISPSPSIAPSPSATPAGAVDQLINDLRAAGVEAREAGAFEASPLGNIGIQLCVGGEPVNVYAYSNPAEAAAAAGMIDPNDPSNIGTAIIEWVGEPKFWLRDRLIVLYLGTDEPVVNALLSVLGDPFAARAGGRPPLVADDC